MQQFPKEILEEIRRHLEEEKTNIEARISELSLQDPYADPGRLTDNAASDVEATEESNHDRVAALISQLTAQRDDVNGALIRIGNGTYGFCTNCGKMIDTDRLAILPTATLCLDCEAKKKKK
jgi:RNA polymerase-binding transcription factor DksA